MPKSVNDYVVESELQLEQSGQMNPKLFARLEVARRQIGSKRL